MAIVTESTMAGRQAGRQVSTGTVVGSFFLIQKLEAERERLGL